MAQLVVRNLDSDLIHRLKQRAAEQGVSAEEEHRRILRRALFGPEEEFPDLKSLLIMPDVGEDEDFARLSQLPPDRDWS
ncbi:MAG TPA: DNA-binding protein [Thermoanaerobaculia bacterium]|nr:DNA-binding protein [Thermoanaerobaculia bacterium]